MKKIFLFGENFNTWLHEKYYNIYHNILCYEFTFSPVKLILPLATQKKLSYNKNLSLIQFIQTKL